eukprot:jgi/Mesvir1/11617/Mv00023-RA.1
MASTMSVAAQSFSTALSSRQAAVASCNATVARSQAVAPVQKQLVQFDGLRAKKLFMGSDAAATLSAFMPCASSTARPSSAATSRAVTSMEVTGGRKNVLILGGTRFIGQYLSRELVKQGHQVTLLTRGKSPITQQIPDDTPSGYASFKSKIKHIACDRTDAEKLKAALRYTKFDAVYDINGREASDAKIIIEALPGPIQQYIFCSSAGVYLKSLEMPHFETDAGDKKSRHKGKLDTEEYLQAAGVAWTSIRPVYIYGPLNYNPVEEWFFHRIAAGRPIPIPNSGMQVTQLGHVKDLAIAFAKCLGNPKVVGQIYNVAGDRYVTFDGIAKACAKAAGAPAPEIIHYDPKEFDFGKAKAFPLRDVHFFTNIEKAKRDLDWEPMFDLVEGLRDSWEKDYKVGRFCKGPDFTTDDMILSKVKKSVSAR